MRNRERLALDECNTSCCFATLLHLRFEVHRECLAEFGATGSDRSAVRLADADEVGERFVRFCSPRLQWEIFPWEGRAGYRLVCSLNSSGWIGPLLVGAASG
jgi:hypothetical protein